MLLLVVKKDRVAPVLGRHPWVFSQALLTVPDGIEAGTPVRLVDPAGRYLASGYFNSYSQIAVRIWSYEDEEAIDHEFFLKRILRAKELRERYIADEDTNAYRLINSENDLLPGLVVDKYSDWLVIQCHTRGIETWKEGIISALIEAIKPRGIYERSDLPSRKDGKKALIYGTVPELITIRENGLRFLVDVMAGQKTGFFLDQRDKRRALMKYAKDRSVLNCFSYTGGFSVYALSAGATEAVCVDASEAALEIAKENMRINGLDINRCRFINADVKQYLKQINKGQYDIIVLDPPAFIKERRKKTEGLVGYKAINEQAIRLLSSGGILLTCSCSAHLSPQEFRYVVSEAAGRAKSTLQILETYTHGIDHPELMAFTEAGYLKCLIAQVW